VQLNFTIRSGIDDSLKRAFYETECIRGNWSVRALKRQIASLYFERSGLSTDKEKLSATTHGGVEQARLQLAIRDPYVFEFLGRKEEKRRISFMSPCPLFVPFCFRIWLDGLDGPFMKTSGAMAT
jgi:predicted nuclease of restriction endonuclease-like (RecB) superfamily